MQANELIQKNEAVMNAWYQLEKSISKLEEIREFLNKSSIVDTKTGKRLKTNLSRQVRHSNDILDSVNLAYDVKCHEDRANSSESFVRHITQWIEANKTMADDCICRIF